MVILTTIDFKIVKSNSTYVLQPINISGKYSHALVLLQSQESSLSNHL